MSCLSSSDKARLQAELTDKQTQLDELKAAYTASLKGGVKSYKFDSGEASQAVVYTSPKDLKDLIDETESEINALIRRLGGKGLVNIELRRQSGTYPGGRGGHRGI
jgi:hypothetical protein